MRQFFYAVVKPMWVEIVDNIHPLFAPLLLLPRGHSRMRYLV